MDNIMNFFDKITIDIFYIYYGAAYFYIAMLITYYFYKKGYKQFIYYPIIVFIYVVIMVYSPVVNIKYYNDTIATIPAATENAIEAIGDVDTLIFGGLDRGIDYKEFIEFLKNSNINNLICMPSTGTNIGHLLEECTTKNIKYVQTLKEANAMALKYTTSGKSCLLSPAAASYEYFKNFEEKGKDFEEIVKDN